MKLSVSNLAWPQGADEEAATILSRLGVRAVELAPGKAWPNPTNTTETEAVAVRNWWAERGFEIVAFQALVFGRPELQLFGEADIRQEFAEHLKKIARLAGWVGAGVLVFGSPKNRRKESLPMPEAIGQAAEFFRPLGNFAAEQKTSFGIEANPIEYGCDFVTKLDQAVELVKAVNSSGFGLHLDTGGLYLSKDPLPQLEVIRPIHFHISEPNLVPIGQTVRFPHSTYAEWIHNQNYSGYFSVEMLAAGEWQVHLEDAVKFAQQIYGQ